MNQISKLLFAACFSLAFVISFESTSTQVEAQVVGQACGCGNKACKGCLKGKLFPVKKAHAKTKQPCNCSECQAAGGPEQRVISDVLVNTEVLPPVAVSEATCGTSNCKCKRCRPKRQPRRAKCPECDCDFCELTVSQSSETQTCYDVKQKEVCIPPVRFPWMKDCPPNKAKVRVVNVLQRKTYECPKCKYEWTVHEPAVPVVAGDDSGSTKRTFSDQMQMNQQPSNPVSPAAPRMNLPNPVNMKLDSVPRPPVEGN